MSQLPPRPHRSSSSSLTLIGRHREMAALEAALDDALSGRGGLVFITGESGIGKTRLAVELRSHVLAQGVPVAGGQIR